MNFLSLTFIIFFIIYKIESGKIQTNFDEIFGEEWNKNENEEEMIKIEQNEENENSTVEQMGGEKGTHPNDQQKREIIQKFDAIKEKLRKNGLKLERKKHTKIERKIGKLLGTNRQKIYKWKKELNLNKNKIMKKSFYEGKKCEFIERINEFKSLYGQGKQKKFVKELGISNDTFWKWKKELVPNYNKIRNKNSNEQKLKKMKQYFEIKERNPKISDEIIAGKLGISRDTLRIWKKKFALISTL